MKHKVSELTGGLLDAAVAKANGRPFDINPIGDGLFCYIQTPYDDGSQINSGRTEWIYFGPSGLWKDGGPIIERERIAIEHGPTEDLANNLTWESAPKDRPWHAWVTIERPEGGGLRFPAFATTPLIAAMRAYVCSKLGEEVELP